jgi:ribonuclease Z
VFDEPQQQQTQCEHDQQQQQLQQQQQQLHSQPLPGGRRVLVLGDTVDSSCIAPAALGADLVAHEATYASGMETKAAIAQHSTAWMAGKFAAALRARALVLTHFSARYESALANGPPPGHGRRSGAGGRGGEVRRVRAWEIAAAEAAERAADERAVAALAREAGEHFRRGQVLLAVDLFTAHVPARLPRGEVAPES